jgi:hypothetical protein
MPDQCAELDGGNLQFTVQDLPPDVAKQIKVFQLEDPQFVRKLILYGVTHRVVFETLSRAWPAGLCLILLGV